MVGDHFCEPLLGTEIDAMDVGACGRDGVPWWVAAIVSVHLKAACPPWLQSDARVVKESNHNAWSGVLR